MGRKYETINNKKLIRRYERKKLKGNIISRKIKQLNIWGISEKLRKLQNI